MYTPKHLNRVQFSLLILRGAIRDRVAYKNNYLFILDPTEEDKKVLMETDKEIESIRHRIKVIKDKRNRTASSS